MCVVFHGVIAVSTLATCSNLVLYTSGPNTAIAAGHDAGIGSGVLLNGHAATAYDPDGCQGWIMDNGVKSYAERRYDRKSGLPACNNQHPAGTALGDYT